MPACANGQWSLVPGSSLPSATMCSGDPAKHYDGFGLQAQITDLKTIRLRIHDKFGVVLDVTTQPPE
jgi:hypothetical protein